MRNLVPQGLSRLANRQLLKLNANSPTILVATGIVGFGATAVLAARATRKLDDVLEGHDKGRYAIDHQAYVNKRARGQAIVHVYSTTGWELTKLYGPTLVVGTLSTASILAGHNMLRRRHLATVAAYSSLLEQFGAYRQRVARTLGETAEQDIYNGAHGEYVEDPDHPGEFKMQPKWNELEADYLHPWYREGTSVNWKSDPMLNYIALKGVQTHMNDLLHIRGFVTLNDVYDALGMTRVPEGMVAGWVRQKDGGTDGHVDLGFMGSRDPNSVAFCEQRARDVQLNFNIDGNIYDLLIHNRQK